MKFGKPIKGIKKKLSNVEKRRKLEKKLLNMDWDTLWEVSGICIKLLKLDLKELRKNAKN